MQLLNYLNQYFYTKSQLLELSGINEADFNTFQQKKMMPLASYKIDLSISGYSFFGDYDNAQCTEYYAKGYLTWLGEISEIKDETSAKLLFTERYKSQLIHLAEQGFLSSNTMQAQVLNSHIAQEWSHFLKGIYGLCTQSGMPEDIASKELAVIIINELIIHAELNKSDLLKLESAVN